VHIHPPMSSTDGAAPDDPPTPHPLGDAAPGRPEASVAAALGAALVEAARQLGVEGTVHLDALTVARTLEEVARAGGDDWAAVEPLAQRVGLRIVRGEAPFPDRAHDVCLVRAGTPTGLEAPGAEPGLTWMLAQAGEAHDPTDPEHLRRPLDTLLIAGWAVLTPLAPFTGHHGAPTVRRPDETAPPEEHASPWKRVRTLVRLERREITVLVFYAAFGALLSLAVPVAVQALVNTLLFGTLIAPVLWLSLLVAAGLLLAATLQLAQAWAVELLQRRIVVNIVAELAWRLPRARMEALDGEHRYRLANRFFDVVIVQKAVSTLLTDGVASAVSAVAGTVLLALYHPYLLGYAVALWLLVALVVVGWAGRATRAAIDESYAKHAVAGWMEEALAHPHALRGAGGAAWAWARADALSSAYLDARATHFRAWFLQVAAILGIYALASAALLSIGGALVLAGQLTVGQLVAAELVVTVALGGLTKVGKQLEKVYDLVVGLDKIGHLLEIPVETAPREPRSLPQGPIPLRAERLGYTYDDGSVAFADVDLDLGPGAFVAVAGASGSGRRTLLEVLSGRRAPTAGRLAYAGVRVDTLGADARAEAVALVREPDTVEGTVAENVHLGRSRISSEDVERAIDRVRLRGVMDALPEGLVLTPHGRPLSEGSALRLALARALAGRPRVLLVDARHAALRSCLPDLKDEGRVTIALVDDPAPSVGFTHRLLLHDDTATLEVCA
jgi:putative ABC transport system ATP-binding protein